MVEEESTTEFPFVSDYYVLIKGITLSKRGNWWTALLLLETKTEKKGRKISLYRWRKRQDNWSRSKEFTLSSPKQWEAMKTSINKWINDKDWR
ncbi:MAG: hypothetical protein ACFFCQ_03675 [Promethearchaeota archaeon]